ncbi:tubulin-like doman-containing protein [bacterium]|nr:tubulin-like doman-containing protein [bacterium]
MINPSIFIGLGSTGTDILEHLQLLLLEEYGVASLPIFKYIGIETNQSHNPVISPGVKNEIEMIYATISSTLKIKDALIQNERPYLESWLDEAILDIPGNSFTLGASNIRQAGRLCLWENWSKCTEALNDAKAKVTNNTNIRETISLLRQYYKKVGKKVSLSEDMIGSIPNVYIVGSLCGGTCSGMLIDVAYYLRHLFGLWAANYANRLSTNIQGIFTILDEKLLSRGGFADVDKWTANCWASILEVDFYSHPSSMFEVDFPDGVKVRSNDTPLDYGYLLSCTGQGGTFWKQDGKEPDLDGLNHMVAMVLFTEAIGGLYGKKEEIRTDFRGFANAGVPNKNEHTPVFASCGISAIWYPKYRISESAACQIVNEICLKWQGDPDNIDRTKIEEEAKTVWSRILNESMSILTRKPGGSIEGQIKEKFDNQRSKLMTTPIRSILEDIDIERLTLKLKEEEENDRIITNQLAVFKKNFAGALEEAVLNRIEMSKNLSDVDYFLEILDKEAEKVLAGLPPRYPIIAPFYLEELERKTKVSPWASLSLKGKEISKQKREEIFNQCYHYLVGTLKNIRDFRARQVLNNVREILGVGVLPSVTEDKTVSIRTLKQYLTDITIKLGFCTSKLLKQSEQAAKGILREQSVEIIANNERNDVLEDIKVLKGKLTSLGAQGWNQILSEVFTITEGEVSRKESLHEFLRYADNEIILRLVGPFQRAGLELIEGFNIAADVQKKMDRATLVLVAKRALPYLGLCGDLVNLHRPPNFLCGNDEVSMTNIKSLETLLSDPSSQNRISFGKTIRTPEVDHLLIFYTEQGLLHMDENLTTSSLFQNKYKKVAAKDLYELHSRKGGRIHFDVTVERRKREARKLLRIAKELFSSRDGKSSEVFEATKEGFILRYIDSIGIHSTWLIDRQGIEVITEDEHVFELFKDKVTKKIFEVGKEEIRNRVNDRITFLEKAEGQEAARKEAEYYKEVILEYFS